MLGSIGHHCIPEEELGGNSAQAPWASSTPQPVPLPPPRPPPSPSQAWSLPQGRAAPATARPPDACLGGRTHQAGSAPRALTQGLPRPVCTRSQSRVSACERTKRLTWCPQTPPPQPPRGLKDHSRCGDAGVPFHSLHPLWTNHEA